MSHTFFWNKIAEARYQSCGIPLTCRLCGRKFKVGDRVLVQGGKIGIKKKERVHVSCLEKSRY